MMNCGEPRRCRASPRRGKLHGRASAALKPACPAVFTAFELPARPALCAACRLHPFVFCASVPHHFSRVSHFSCQLSNSLPPNAPTCAPRPCAQARRARSALKGLTEAVLAEIEVHLGAHQLIKIRVFGDDRDARVAIYDENLRSPQARALFSISASCSRDLEAGRHGARPAAPRRERPPCRACPSVREAAEQPVKGRAPRIVKAEGSRATLRRAQSQAKAARARQRARHGGRQRQAREEASGERQAAQHQTSKMRQDPGRSPERGDARRAGGRRSFYRQMSGNERAGEPQPSVRDLSAARRPPAAD